MEENGQKSIHDNRYLHSSLLLIFDWQIFIRKTNSNNLHRSGFQCSSRDLLCNLLLPRSRLVAGNLPRKINSGLPVILHGLSTWRYRHRQNPNPNEQPPTQWLSALHCDLEPTNNAGSFFREVHQEDHPRVLAMDSDRPSCQCCMCLLFVRYVQDRED